MEELLLHHIWQHRRYDDTDLKATSGAPLQVLNAGTYNRDAGPDFLNARVLIHGMQWVGNVEIHVRASDWKRHGHTLDPAYANCILHVVWEHDVEVSGPDGLVLPVLELRSIVPHFILDRYQSLMTRKASIACAYEFSGVPLTIREAWSHRMMAEWLEVRTALMRVFLEKSRGHWEEAFYHALFRAYGFHTNGDPFEHLSNSIPLGILLRIRDKPFTLSALCFGMAGFLEGRFYQESDHHFRFEFQYLLKKWSLLKPGFPGWKFMRMRPSNFPTKRLAQFLDLHHRSSPLLSRIMEAETLVDLFEIFRTDGLKIPLPASVRMQSTEVMGESSIRIVVTNTVIPFLFLKAQYEGDLILRERVFQWMEDLDPEENAVIRVWKGLGWVPDNAAQSQGMLHLFNAYCTSKKCLNCEIGNRVLCQSEEHPLEA